MILKMSEGQATFTAGKYVGKNLDEVAVKDPTYMTWVYNKAALDLPDELFYALQDVLKSRGIKPFDVL